MGGYRRSRLISVRQRAKKPCGNNNSFGLQLEKKMSDILASMSESSYGDNPLCSILGKLLPSVWPVVGGEKGLCLGVL